MGDRTLPPGNLTRDTTTGRPAHPLFPTGFLYESARDGRPADRSVLNFQYVVRRFDNVAGL